MIADNLAAHKSAKTQKLLRDQGNWMLFLSLYSTNMNSIEMACSKLKAYLRRMAVRTFDALTEAVGSICDLSPLKECQAYFKAARYFAE